VLALTAFNNNKITIIIIIIIITTKRQFIRRSNMDRVTIHGRRTMFARIYTYLIHIEANSRLTHSI